MLSPGDKVKDYEVIAPIRSGGMAMLYLARRRGVGGFSRLVALKLVHAHLTDDPDINRLFLQEARIAASIAHPNVVHVEEVGSVDGKYFIAMEYVHGVSLDELLLSLRKRRMRMSAKLCVWVAAQVSEALHAVHEATWENGTPLNIVHRDVSPQNVLVGHNGHLKLIDFGIAKSQLVGQGSSRGSVIGKLRYMAPEQLRAQSVSRRTDVYALGVMLWEMLASRNLLRCFRIDDERDWLTRENPPSPSRHASNLNPALDQAVLKAIACDPDERYENALSFRTALLRAEPSAARVDAPAFAALLHNVLGEELERRRANWPREVNVELESDVGCDTDRSFDLEELTARLRPADTSDPPESGEQEAVTSVESAPDVRHDVEKTVLQRLTSADRSSPRPPSLQALIPTVAAPASTAKPIVSPAQKLKHWVWTTRLASTLFGALLVALVAYAAGAAERRYLQRTGDDPPSATLRTTPSASAQAPARSQPDAAEIALAGEPETLKLRPSPARIRVAPATSAKRALGAGKIIRRKGKLGVGARGHKPRRL